MIKTKEGKSKELPQIVLRGFSALPARELFQSEWLKNGGEFARKTW
jgi:hypothetical protein